MKDKIIEILERTINPCDDNTYESVANEILALFAEPPAIEPIELEGLTISFTPAWGGYIPKVSWKGIDYAGIDPVKWGEIYQNTAKWYFGIDWGKGDDRYIGIDDCRRINKYFAPCPEELKEAYKAIRDVREALLKLEKRITGETLERIQE